MTFQHEQYETEAFLVNSLFFRPNQVYAINLQPKHLLYYPDVLESIIDQVNRTSVVDAMEIRRHMAKTRNISLDATRPILTSLIDTSMGIEAGGSAEWLLERHQIRRIADLGRVLVEKSSDANASLPDMLDSIESFQRDNSPLSENKSELATVDDWLKRRKLSGFTPTGMSALDRIMDGGLYDGNVYGLAGYAKSGKTMLAGTISGNLNRAGVKHLYVAMEMGAGDIAIRQIAREMGIEAKELRGGGVAIPSEKIHNNVIYADAPGITWTELQMKMLSAVYRDKVKGIVIDYWQLIQTRDSRVEKHQFWADVAQGISDFVKKHNIWCILLAQQNDDGRTLGSRALVRACDMLLHIERCENDESHRWVRMEASRYTEHCSLGDKDNGYLEIDRIGPHMKQLFT